MKLRGTITLMCQKLTLTSQLLQQTKRINSVHFYSK
ncbi:vicilin-like seed storage protein [Iris pallida]|uniref:Vicilin-like seed storage protein n=1 Tax=Iris pallida TaxID=29817 RepID=A0AAX6EDC7_IRIPA|nr:vicilin-like seed storage protein [Iris pallida]